ncbi:MAG: hypothetical protein MI867_28350 [Pseudomonadales bacterium]|nr:hypothetical protein [Pseudomonadales bacterium]
MIRMALFSALFSCTMLLSNAAVQNSDDFGLTSKGDLTVSLIEANKNKKNKELQKRAEKVLEPIIQLKESIEAQIPEKELNTIKRVAFKVMLIARKYL